MGRKWVAVAATPVVGLVAWWVLAQEPRESEDALQARVRAGAEASVQALLTGDDERVVELTYPRVVERLGGRDAMLRIIATSRAYMREQGFEMLSYTVDTVSDVYEAGDELHAVARTIMKAKVPGAVMIQPGFLLAISGDGGETWRYVDGAQLDADTVLDVVPAFNDALELPTQLEPTFEPDPPQEHPDPDQDPS